MSSYIPVEIPKRARACCLNNEPFKPGEVYYSRLSVDYERQDFCEKCWDKKPLHMTLTTWQGRVPPKTKIEQNLDRLERALQMLREGEDPVDRMIMALFLVRKKWLELRNEYKKQGQTYQIYEVVATEEMIEIEKKVLSLQDAIRQETIATRLREGL